MSTLGRWRCWSSLLTLVCIVGLPHSASACPGVFVTATFRAQIQQAPMAMVGTLKKARHSAALKEPVIDFEIESVLKPHAALKDKQVLTFKGRATQFEERKMLVFCDIAAGVIDAYGAHELKPDSKLAEYLQGALVLPEKEVGKALRYFFDYLDHPEQQIQDDAHGEWANADYKDYRELAKSLPAHKLAAWLGVEKTPKPRLSLYGLLLGHCGKANDALLLLKLLEQQQQQQHDRTASEGLLTGYILLEPKKGWEFAIKTIKNRELSFSHRYSALRSLRFFWKSRPDVLTKKQLLEGLALLAECTDIADLVIEDLRRWKQWQMFPQVLPLHSGEATERAYIHHALIRFALQASPHDKLAADFIKIQREEDAERVSTAEERLSLEK